MNAKFKIGDKIRIKAGCKSYTIEAKNIGIGNTAIVYEVMDWGIVCSKDAGGILFGQVELITEDNDNKVETPKINNWGF